VFDSADETSRAVARVIARRLHRHPASVLGLPTGRTSVPVYAELVRLRPRFARAHTFNLDEFVGLGPRDAGSYRAFMERHLFRHVDIPARHVHVLNGTAPDLDRECARFERAIAVLGGIDLVVLGIGANGHIGFNEPSAALQARTHRGRLQPGTRAANAALFGGDVTRVPEEALSMGMATILRSRAVVLMATGASKADAVEAMLRGPITTLLPASFLQLHAGVTVMVDRSASRR
jgi:glucosamine-6-phosphate deaminase